MSKEQSPAFQFYASDFLADIKVQQMTMEEEGCYIHLLALCWRERRLPADPTVLQRCLKGGVPTELVLSCFEEHDGYLTHRRLEAERQKQADWRAKSALGGKHSSHKPKRLVEQQGGATTVQADRFKGGSTLQSSSSSSSLSSNIPPNPPRGKSGSNNLFDRFYAAYPRHENPKKAREAWNKLDVDEGLLERMLEWLKAAATSDQWHDKTLIPHPATWLNQRRWEGDPPPAPKQPATLLDKWEEESRGR